MNKRNFGILSNERNKLNKKIQKKKLKLGTFPENILYEVALYHITGWLILVMTLPDITVIFEFEFIINL